MPTLNFTERDWDRIEHDTMAWWAGELDRPLIWLSTTDPLSVEEQGGYFSKSESGLTAQDMMSNYPLDMPVEQVIERYDAFFAATHYYADAFPWWFVNFGPGIVAGFLGANVHSVSGPPETVWFTPPQKTDIEALTLEYDPFNVWWQRVKELTAAIVARYDRRLAVSHTDLGGNLDILASFCETQGLLFDLVDHPEHVERLASQITALWLQYYDELDALIRPACRGTTTWAPSWSTGKTYMLQSDFAYMISPAMFERFVLPGLTACCEHLDHGFYHLDGVGQIPHLDMLLSIQRLRGIQWIPGRGQPQSDQWLPLLKRIRDGGKLCQIYVTPDGARRIVKNLGGKGFHLLIWEYGRDFADPEQARAFLDNLAREDISQTS